MLSAAELNLFMNGDPKSIDYSSSFLQDQVVWSPELPPEPQSHSLLKIYLLPYKTSLEFPQERLSMGKEIGAGAFGRVLKAVAVGGDFSLLFLSKHQ